MLGTPAAAAPDQSAEVAPPAKPEKAPAAAPDMVFYIAKGAPDSCGRGCDTWIAAEGQFDSVVAARFRRFLSQQKDRTIPVYFHSPGGNVDQSIEMGKMLRSRDAIVRVGRTVVKECATGAPSDTACLKLKQMSRVHEAELVFRGAVCASACTIAFVGGTTREVSPETVFGVHTIKAVLRFRGASTPSAALQAAAVQRSRDRMDRNISDYMRRMGVSSELHELAKTVKVENLHPVTRDELFRFGVDTRKVVELPWKIINSHRPIAHKIAIERDETKPPFRMLQLFIACSTGGKLNFGIRRQTLGGLPITRFLIAGSGKTHFELRQRVPMNEKDWDVWYAPVSTSAALALVDQSGLHFMPATQDWRAPLVHPSFTLSTLGLPAMINQVGASCPFSSPKDKNLTAPGSGKDKTG